MRGDPLEHWMAWLEHIPKLRQGMFTMSFAFHESELL